MALKAVFFDVGETLINELRYWNELARRLGLEPHVLWSALGVTIARREEHTDLWRHLGMEPPELLDVLLYDRSDLYPDALPCLEALRERGYFVGIVGNQTAALEEWARAQELPVDVVASSARWGVRKPQPEFFSRIVAECDCDAFEIAYVGDRVDNDVLPAKAAGMVAVHVRRGPWGYLQDASAADIRVDSLAALPEALSL